MASQNNINNVVPANNFTAIGDGGTSGILIARGQAVSTTATAVVFQKDRAGAVITTGDYLGNLNYSGHDGTQYTVGAQIISQSSGTIGASRIPANLTFWTKPDSATAITQRMTIASTGAVTIAAPDSGVGLTVSGGGETITSGNLTISSGLIALPTTSSTVGQITINATRFLHGYGTNNVFVGPSAGNFTLTSTDCVAVGYQALNAESSGLNTVAIGSGALLRHTSGNANTMIGYQVASNLLTGAGNLALGVVAGSGPVANSWTGSESYNICIGNSGTIGDNNIIRIGTDGTGTGQQSSFITVRNVTTTTAASGVTNTFTVSNTSNTASSQATVTASVAGSTAGDATFTATTTTTAWSWGADNSVTSPTADPFVVSQSTTLGTNNILSAATSGEINYPLQPAFLATITNNITDVTGDGTSYTVIFDNEIYDQNADFNLGTSVFTAPVTGRYHFSAGLFLQQLGVLFTDYRLTLVTSNRNYSFKRYSPSSLQTSGLLADCGSTYADMDAGDTATLTILVAGSTKTVDILGDTGAANFFGGKLVA